MVLLSGMNFTGTGTITSDYGDYVFFTCKGAFYSTSINLEVFRDVRLRRHLAVASHVNLKRRVPAHRIGLISREPYRNGAF